MFSSEKETNKRMTRGIIAYLEGFKPGPRDRDQPDRLMLGSYTDCLVDGNSLATQDVAISINGECDTASGRTRIASSRNRADQPAVAGEVSAPTSDTI